MTVNLDEATAHLSQLVEAAANGETVVITKAGKPMAKLTAIDAPPKQVQRRIGFLEGRYTVPDDFEAMCAQEIETLFNGQ